MRHLLTFSKGDAAQKQQQAGGIDPARRLQELVQHLGAAKQGRREREHVLQGMGLQDRSTTLRSGCRAVQAHSCTVSGQCRCTIHGALAIKLNIIHSHNLQDVPSL